MLGLLMTTTLFYAVIRFGNISEKQEETIEYQTQKAFFDSYMDYLRENPTDMSGDYEGIEDGVSNISITLTQTIGEITGAVESDNSITYTDISGDTTGNIEVKIEYNLCENNTQTEFANVEITPPFNGTPASQPCASFDYYNHVLVTLAEDNDLILTSLDAPFHYKITGTDLKDTKWHLDADMRFGFGKRLRVSEVFKN